MRGDLNEEDITGFNNHSVAVAAFGNVLLEEATLGTAEVNAAIAELNLPWKAGVPGVS